jgi:hypothetical protein
METRMTIKFSDITGGGIPFGNNAGRPANPGIGKLYSNGEEKRLELYTSTGWQNIVSETPGVVSISGSYLESNNTNSIEITGTNFSTGAIASVIGSNGVEVNANSTTVNSIVSVTAVFSGLIGANEPYDVKVTNPSNLFGLLPDALYVNNILSWQTPAGSLGTFGDNVAVSISAVATDDSTITYSLASGSSLPSGLTLNSSNGLISGTLPDITSNTTYTFTINASDGANPAVARTFSIASNAAPTWVTSSGSLGTFSEQSSVNVTVSATDPSDVVAYTLASGSSLPSGITLNSSTGVISGTLPDIASDTTYNFTINASDGINSIPRSFSLSSGAQFQVQYLVIAGGGAGAQDTAGGGGAGGYRSSVIGEMSGGGASAESPFLASVATPYSLLVGNGGTRPSGPGQNNGQNSQFASIVSLGGGSPGGSAGFGANGYSGGSGGGAYNGTPGSGTTGQGYAGANTSTGGGGGGAGSAGSGNNGGSGVSSSITGTAVTRAGGGGGLNGTGGSGGGGTNTGYQATSNNGVVNTGGGGSAHSGSWGGAGNGGSGIVILKYPDSKTASYGGTLVATTTSPVVGFKVTSFTAGSGSVTFI